jgi:hypothetical protein
VYAVAVDAPVLFLLIKGTALDVPRPRAHALRLFARRHHAASDAGSPACPPIYLQIGEPMIPAESRICTTLRFSACISGGREAPALKVI